MSFKMGGANWPWKNWVVRALWASKALSHAFLKFNNESVAMGVITCNLTIETTHPYHYVIKSPCNSDPQNQI